MPDVSQLPDTRRHLTIFDLPIKDAIDYHITTLGISTGGQDVFHEGQPNPVSVVTLDRTGGNKGRTHVLTLTTFDAIRNEVEKLLTDPDLTVGDICVWQVGISRERIIEAIKMIYEVDSEEDRFFGIDLIHLRQYINDEYMKTPYHVARRLCLLLSPNTFTIVKDYMIGGNCGKHLSHYLASLDDNRLVDFVLYHFHSMYLLTAITQGIMIPKETPNGFMYQLWFGYEPEKHDPIIILVPFASDHSDWLISGKFDQEEIFDVERNLENIWAKTNDRNKLRATLALYLNKKRIVRFIEKPKATA